MRFNSWNATRGSQARLYLTTSISLVGTTTPQLTLWVFHNPGAVSYVDRVQAQVSTDDGASWTSVGSAIPRYDASSGWKQHAIDLSAYVDQANIRIGLLGISDWGYDIYVDDLQVTRS